MPRFARFPYRFGLLFLAMITLLLAAFTAACTKSDSSSETETQNNHGASTLKVAPKDDEVSSLIRYSIEFNVASYTTDALVAPLDEDSLASTLAAAQKENEWLVIDRISQEFPNHSAGQAAQQLIDDRVRNYKKHFVTSMEDGELRIPIGGIGIFSGELGTVFKRRTPRFSIQQESHTLTLVDTYAPLELAVFPLSLSATRSSPGDSPMRFDAAFLVDPEAEPGELQSFRVTARVSGPIEKLASFGSIVSSDGEFIPSAQSIDPNDVAQCWDVQVRARIVEEPKFTRETVFDMYLAGMQAQRTARKLLSEGLSQLSIDSTDEDRKSVLEKWSKAQELGSESKVYLSQVPRAALHRSSAIADAARRCLVAAHTTAGRTITIEVPTRGAPAADRDPRLRSYEARFPQLAEMLAVLDRAAALPDPSRLSTPTSGPQDPDYGWLEGAKNYLQLMVAEVLSGEREYLEQLLSGEQRENVIRLLNLAGSPAARAFLDSFASIGRNTEP